MIFTYASFTASRLDLHHFEINQNVSKILINLNSVFFLLLRLSNAEKRLTLYNLISFIHILASEMNEWVKKKNHQNVFIIIYILALQNVLSSSVSMRCKMGIPFQFKIRSAHVQTK